MKKEIRALLLRMLSNELQVWTEERDLRHLLRIGWIMAALGEMPGAEKGVNVNVRS